MLGDWFLNTPRHRVNPAMCRQRHHHRSWLIVYDRSTIFVGQARGSHCVWFMDLRTSIDNGNAISRLELLNIESEKESD